MDSEEQLDIVTEEGSVVSTVGKSVAHRDGLLHQIVIAELKNKKGEYCFVQQAPDRQDPGQFVSPVGGHVSAGETLEQALIRESQEEVGITPIRYRFLGKTRYDREVIGRHENHLFCVFEIETDETPALNHESVAFHYFSPAEIKQTLRDNPQLFGAAWHHVFKNILPYIYLPQYG